MKQLLIKPEKCIGCRTCELVCSFGHYGHFNPKLANVKVFEYEQTAVAILPSVRGPLLSEGLSRPGHQPG